MFSVWRFPPAGVAQNDFCLLSLITAYYSCRAGVRPPGAGPVPYRHGDTEMETEMKSKFDGRVVAVVESDSSNRKYKIRVNEDGHLVCPCMSFRYAVGEFGSASKTCKHIERLQRRAA